MESRIQPGLVPLRQRGTGNLNAPQFPDDPVEPGILDSIRGLEWESYNRSVDVLISRLRRKLNDDPKDPVYIKTVWGSGYIFIGEENA